MELQEYSTEELKAELKRRAEAKRAEQQSVKRCRMCKHWGEINYWGGEADRRKHHIRLNKILHFSYNKDREIQRPSRLCISLWLF